MNDLQMYIDEISDDVLISVVPKMNETQLIDALLNSDKKFELIVQNIQPYKLGRIIRKLPDKKSQEQ